MRQSTPIPDPRATEPQRAPLGSRLLLLLKGFSEKEADHLAFVAWLADDRSLGGPNDGVDRYGR